MSAGSAPPGKGFQKNGAPAFQPQSSGGFKNFQGPAGYSGMPNAIQLKNKKGTRHQPGNYVKNQSVQITGEDGLSSTLTAHEAATFYSSVMNT